LTNGVDKVHTRHPLVRGELDFASKVVEMSDEAAENLTVSVVGFGANGLDDMVGEVGVESGSLVASHCC